MAVVGILVLLAGCSSPHRPPLEDVHGRVTRDGAPVEGVLVEFEPWIGRTSFGRTDASGKYRLDFSNTWKGALVGEHRVRLRAPTVSPQQIPNYATLDPAAQDSALQRELTEVPHRIKVIEGRENVFDFELNHL